MSMLFENVKTGDMVWLGGGGSRWPKRALGSVAHVTPKQIVLDGGDRYRKDNGRRANGWTLYNNIVSVATPEEVAQWEAERAEKRRETEERRAEYERTEGKRKELCGLFGDNAYVREEDGQWEVRITTDEDGVRNIARLLADGI